MSESDGIDTDERSGGDWRIRLAFIIFVMVRQINRLKSEAPPPPPPATPEDVLLLREIRDSLRK